MISRLYLFRLWGTNSDPLHSWIPSRSSQSPPRLCATLIYPWLAGGTKSKVVQLVCADQLYPVIRCWPACKVHSCDASCRQSWGGRWSINSGAKSWGLRDTSLASALWPRKFSCLPSRAWRVVHQQASLPQGPKQGHRMLQSYLHTRLLFHY